MHHGEILVDNIIGMFVNFFLVFLIYNWWQGQDITVAENLWGTAAFFVAAYIRKYTIRRWTSNGIGKLYDLKDRIDAEVQEQAGEN